VELNLLPTLVAPDASVFPDKPAGETWYRVRVENDLEVTEDTLEEIDENTTWSIRNPQEFVVRPDPRPEHEGKWLLRQHRELEPAGRATDFSSWGMLKARCVTWGRLIAG
jgi:hypothetical protein